MKDVDVYVCCLIPHSQAQCQVAQAHAKTKTCHRACLSANAVFADTKKLNLLRQRKRND